MPQARPSLRLLTSRPGCAAERAFSLKLVSRNTSCVDRPSWSAADAATCVVGLVARVAVGLAHEESRQAEAERGVGDAEEERLGPQPVRGRR